MGASKCSKMSTHNRLADAQRRGPNRRHDGNGAKENHDGGRREVISGLTSAHRNSTINRRFLAIILVGKVGVESLEPRFGPVRLARLNVISCVASFVSEAFETVCFGCVRLVGD